MFPFFICHPVSLAETPSDSQSCFDSKQTHTLGHPLKTGIKECEKEVFLWFLLVNCFCLYILRFYNALKLNFSLNFKVNSIEGKARLDSQM